MILLLLLLLALKSAGAVRVKFSPSFFSSPPRSSALTWLKTRLKSLKFTLSFAPPPISAKRLLTSLLEMPQPSTLTSAALQPSTSNSFSAGLTFSPHSSTSSLLSSA